MKLRRRAEITRANHFYPWDSLVNVGDCFAVLEGFKLNVSNAAVIAGKRKGNRYLVQDNGFEILVVLIEKHSNDPGTITAGRGGAPLVSTGDVIEQCVGTYENFCQARRKGVSGRSLFEKLNDPGDYFLVKTTGEKERNELIRLYKETAKQRKIPIIFNTPGRRLYVQRVELPDKKPKRQPV